jgi:AmiR/NasT family two-component response regulator
MTSGRVLVLDDEWLLAIDVQDALETAGFEVVGPAMCVADPVRLG